VPKKISSVISPRTINNTLASSPDGQLIAATLQNHIVIVADCTGNLLYTIRRGNWPSRQTTSVLL
jgi:hypothetical protein